VAGYLGFVITGLAAIGLVSARRCRHAAVLRCVSADRSRARASLACVSTYDGAMRRPATHGYAGRMVVLGMSHRFARVGTHKARTRRDETTRQTLSVMAGAGCIAWLRSVGLNGRMALG
jgi:RNase P/RNase MRP subunit POP5